MASRIYSVLWRYRVQTVDVVSLLVELILSYRFLFYPIHRSCFFGLFPIQFNSYWEGYIDGWLTFPRIYHANTSTVPSDVNLPTYVPSISILGIIQYLRLYVLMSSEYCPSLRINSAIKSTVSLLILCYLIGHFPCCS